jgi:ELWxxDGT repeat protein
MGRISKSERTALAIIEPLEVRRLLSAELVKDIFPVAGPEYGKYETWESRPPGQVTQAGSLNLFSAYDKRFGYELWRTDGTAAGTYMVADLVRGEAGSNPAAFTEFGGHAYFLTQDALWRTDGTSRGTTRVEVEPGVEGTTPLQIKSLKGALYVTDRNVTGAARLWRIDATGAVTRLLQQRTGSKFGAIGQILELGDLLVFAQQDTRGNQSLWRTDGTVEGTFELKPVYVVDHHMVRLGSALYFFSSYMNGKGTALWRTDGTPDGTAVVSVLSEKSSLRLTLGVASGKLLYFSGYDEQRGQELWKTDGTGAGTGPVADLWTGNGSLPPGPFVPELEYPAGEGPICACISNGNPYPYWAPNNSSPGNFAATSRGVIFTASDQQGLWLYHSDGTPEGTVRLPSMGPQQRVTGIRTIGNTVFIALQTGMYENGAIIASDGTPSGTRLVWAAPTRSTTYVPATDITSLSNVNGWLFFAGYTHTAGKELMRFEDTGGIIGFAYDDANGNGVRDPSELPLAGWRVFLDRNGDGVFNKGENFVFAEEDGAYGFPAFPHGDYTVRLSRPDGAWTAAPVPAPVRTGRTAWRDVAAARITPVHGSVSGTVCSDEDFGGDLDEGEGGLEGVRIYLDLNRNGYYTPGEPAARTDASGNYSIDGVLPGRYRLAIVDLGFGFEYTRGMETSVAVTGDDALDIDFGIGYDASNGMIHGVTFNDRDGDGAQDGNEPGLAGVEVRLYEGNSISPRQTTVTDAGGYYKFARLRRGSYGVYFGRPAGEWTTTTTLSSRILLRPAQRVLRPRGLKEQPTASISGIAFVDINGDGDRQPQTDPLASGWSVFADLDRDGQIDANEPTAQTSAAGSYTLPNLLSGTYLVRFVPPADAAWTITHGAAATELTLDPGQQRRLNAGATRPSAVMGTVRYDRAGDSNPVGDPGKAGVTVYIDLNHNGRYDATIDRSTVTDARGSYRFDGIPSGTFYVVPVAPPGWTLTSGIYSATVTPSAITTYPAMSVSDNFMISGYFFVDRNGNGSFDTLESMPQHIVYVDLDNDGQMDETEPRGTTVHLGFQIKSVPLGTHVLRFVDTGMHLIPTGMTITLPSPGLRPGWTQWQDFIVELDPAFWPAASLP